MVPTTEPAAAHHIEQAEQAAVAAEAARQEAAALQARMQDEQEG
ncbi:hypothetical protein [Streptomyces sp. NPDC017941]